MTQTKKQVFRFMISGVCAVCTDVVFYYLFSIFINVSLAKAASFIMGTIVAYLMGKYYTFEQREKNEKEMVLFMCLYVFTLCVNVIINRFSLVFLPIFLKSINTNYQALKLMAFLLATGTSTVLNFFGQKFVVFRRKRDEKYEV